MTQAANDPNMLDHAGCWHRLCFLIKYINYEILLQKIASLCPTREWLASVDRELCGVHLQLIRGEGASSDRQASWANTGTMCCQSWMEERAPAEVPGQVGRCLSAQCVACVVPLCRGGVCDCLGQSSQTMSFWSMFPPKKASFCHLLQEALADSSRCSVLTDCAIDLALTRLYCQSPWFVFWKTGNSFTH